MYNVWLYEEGDKRKDLSVLKERKQTEGNKAAYGTLYERTMRSTRGGPLFNAFPYPTKISPEAIALFIATHTDPSATVLDGFGGSGSTGLAAILCGCPTPAMLAEAERLRLPVRWGVRKAVLYELGVLGSFVADVMCHPPDPAVFRSAAESLLADVRGEWDWLYEARDPEGNTGSIRYVVWSDMLACPGCQRKVSLWDACVSRTPAAISTRFRCPHCRHTVPVDKVRRVRESVTDGLLGQERTVRQRCSAWVYGETDGKTWSRMADAGDRDLQGRLAETHLPECIPITPVLWGDLYRAGYHEGMSHLHHFYTRRNLLAFSAMWAAVERFPRELQPALRFWLLSYNAAHSTIMTRVVAKKGQDDLVVTSGQPGVLYVSGLPVEKNLFAGVRRKINTMVAAFAMVHGHEAEVEVRNASCLDLDLPDGSVDYVFTDPPFGGNIPYAEVNFINEAWLGHVTDQAEEAIISPHQGKSADDYRALLERAFRELHRVLRTDGHATVVFHSATAKVWNSLRNACEAAGFNVANTSVLDKTQGSFKQVRTAGAVQGDPLILLGKATPKAATDATDLWVLANRLADRAALSDDPSEATAQRLYSRLVAHYMEARQDVPIDAGAFYQLMPRRRAAYAGQAK